MSMEHFNDTKIMYNSNIVLQLAKDCKRLREKNDNGSFNHIDIQVFEWETNHERFLFFENNNLNQFPLKKCQNMNELVDNKT